MRTKIFEYKGYIGIQSSVNAEGLLNDPMKKGQLGFVLDADYVDIQPEALELLKQIKVTGDDVSDINVYTSNDNKRVIAWLGGPLIVLHPLKSEASNGYEINILTSCTDVTPSESFIKYIDSITE